MSRIGTFDAELRPSTLFDPALLIEGWYEFGLSFSHSLIDTAGGQLFLQSLSGPLSFVGSITSQTSKFMVGKLTESGVVSRLPRHATDGGLSFNGALQSIRTYLVSLVGTLTFSGGLIHQTNKFISGAWSGAGTLRRQTHINPTGLLSTSGNIARRIDSGLSGTLASSGALFRRTNKVLAGMLSLSGAETFKKGKLLMGGLDFPRFPPNP